MRFASWLPWPKYLRFLGLTYVVKRDSGWSIGCNERRARTLLTMAESFRDDWSFGNAVHAAHTALGIAAWKRGDIRLAETELLESANCGGSPQLSSFGPTMRLADKLVRAGSSAAVIRYLEACRAFWPRSDLDRWKDDIANGRVPDFEPNIRY